VTFKTRHQFGVTIYFIIMAGLKDIAKIAGVGTTTVSIILNSPEKAGRFNEDTKKRIREIARRLNYIPDHRARVFQGGKTFTIGVALDTLDERNLFAQPYWSSILGGIHRGLQKHAYQLTLISSLEEERALNIAVRHLRERRVDGIIVPEPLSFDLVHDLGSASKSIALINNPAARGFPGAYSEESKAVEIAVDYLAAKGHRSILWVGPNNWYDDGASTRANSFASATLKKNLQGGAAFFDFEPDMATSKTYPLIKIASEKVAQKLDRKGTYSSVLAFNTDCMLATYRAAADLGLRIPQDLSVVCIDNDGARQTIPECTAIDLQPFEIGYQSAEILVRQLNPGSEHAGPESKAVPPILVERESVTKAREIQANES